MNLYYKDVFPEIDVDELPPQIKYKLPVSEHYDPEGKRVKKEGSNKKLILPFDKIAKLDHDQKEMQKTEIICMEEVSDKIIVEKKEVKEEKHSNILEEESELRRIKQTALQVIEDSLSKTVSLASQLKTTNESLHEEESKLTSQIQELMQAENRYFQKVSKEKIKEKTDSIRKKVSFEDDYREEKVVSNQVVRREVHVADEVKKFERFDLQTDSKLNVEERKLLTQKDIEEAIEAGTVRQRTGMFKTNDTHIGQKQKVETVKTNIQIAKQRVFDIGSQIIPRLHNTVSHSRQSTLLLKRFLLQMTKVMVNLFKFIPRGKIYSAMKSRESLNEYNRKGAEYIHKEHYDEESLKRDRLKEGEIKKPKLSGAKIAQIEGRKPAELTDRMNIVISEFLRKSGREDFSEENEFRGSQTSSSRSESRMKDEYLDDCFYGENVFDKGQTENDFPPRSSFKEIFFKETTSGGEFTKEDSFRKNAFDNKKIFEETFETKTRSYEVKEFKEEKHYSESKTSQFDTKANSYETESVSRDYSVPLTYIAIVEAHVFTNKNAIFEEQMRRMSESLKQTDMSESDIIYYRCEVSVFYRQFREPSLPPTVVVESIEEIPSEQVLEEEKQNIYQTSTYEYEDEAKQLAVQKISEVIEPLLQIKEVKSVNIKQAYPTIEMPLKLISERTTVTLEKEEEKTEILETVERKLRPIVEPTKSIAETSEIFIEEETVGLVETSQAIAELPRPVKVERTLKSAAEISEVIVDEANIGILEVSQSTSTTPRYTIADNLRSIAETMVAIIQEPQEDKDILKITEETSKIGVNETIASEVFEVFPEEPIYEEVTQTGVERRQSEVFMEKSILILPETITTSVEEPVCEELVLSKTSTKEAKIDVEAKVVAEITEVTLNEREQESFDTVKITPKEPGALKEKPVLSVGETKTILAFEPPTEPFEVLEFVEKHTQPFIEDKFLGAAETFSVLPEESNDGYLDTPNIETKRPKTLIEGGLVIAETLLVSPSSPEEGFNLTDTINKKANIKVEESKAITTALVHIEEPKEEILEVIQFLEKKPQASLQDTTLTVPMKIEVVPEGPKDNDFETTIPVQEKAEVDIEELKTASVTVVAVEEPKDVNLEKFTYKENEVRSLLEKPNLNVAETFAVVPEGPLCDSFEVFAITSDKPSIYIDEIKPLTISVVTANEKEIEKMLEVTKFEEKKPVPLTETSVFTVPQIVEIIPDEPKDSFTVTSVTIEQADLKIREFKGRSTTIVYTEEPKEEDLRLPIVEAKQQQPKLEAIHLTAAETSVTLSEESKTSFDTTAATSQQAHIQVIEQKAAEASLVFPLEPRDQNLMIPETVERKPQKLLESPVLTAAENSIIIFEEKVEELPEAIKPKGQKATVCLEGLKVVLVNVIITSELETEFTVFTKSVSRVAKVIIVESEVTAIAKAASVSVEVAKEKVVIKELDLSSPPSTVSSAPSSPSVEWNVFGVATGHLYRVQSPQETSLDIIKPAKEVYGVDAADTSYTLTFEAEYEEEKEILHMEEFSDVVRNKKFWISDIKTMETLEALDARMQLTNVSIGVEDSAIIKSRSQSFDTAAEFEVSLEQSRTISDVQAAATFDLKSEASFKTMEDVESQAKVSIKSTLDKIYSEKSVDVAFGLTIQNDIVVDTQAIELDVQASHDTKVAKSTRKVKKVAKGMALASSESEMEARYEAGINLESRRLAAVERSLETSQTSDAMYLKTEGKLESSKVSAAYASMEASLVSRSASETLQASIKARSVSEGSFAAMESSTETSSVSAESSFQQTSLESQSRGIEVTAMQKGPIEITEIDSKKEGLKLGLETDLKQIKIADKVRKGIKSPSPEEIPSPLRDEYIFRIITDEPEETTFIPRDCSFTPESVHEEPIVPVKGMIPHIDTKIVRVLYSPPLEAAPEIGRKIEPVFTKPGLKGGSETPEYFRAGLKSGSQTPDSARSGFKSGSQTPREFTKVGFSSIYNNVFNCH